MCAATREYKRRNPEKVAESQRQWREANKEHVASYFRDWSSKNRHRKAEYRARDDQRFPEKDAARAALRSAVYRGQVVKPGCCEECGKSVERKGQLHGHHHDYARPLDVEWLCPGCHAERHSGGSA